MNTPGDEREVTLVYGSKSQEDILLREALEAWAEVRQRFRGSAHVPADGRLTLARAHVLQASAGRFKLVHVIGETADAAAPEGWTSTGAYTAAAGWVDKVRALPALWLALVLGAVAARD